MAILTGTDCTTSRLGSGLENCQPIEGLPNGVILTPKGWSLNKTSGTFDKAYVQEQVQLGNFVPLVGCFEAVAETPDATTQESQSGLIEVVRQGKPVFTCTYKKGLAFQKIAFSYNSYQQYDALITYETGYIKCAESVDGTSIKGLSVGMLNTNGYTENNGTNSASTILKFQVTDPFEYNQYVNLLTDLDFNPNTELFGITDVTLTGRATNGGTRLFVKAAWLHNEQFPITGLSATNFKLTLNGTDIPLDGAVTYDSTTKEYSIPPDSAITTGQSWIVTLYDDANDVACAQLGNKFYRGNTGAFVVTA
jgi:hypothetical protein